MWRADWRTIIETPKKIRSHTPRLEAHDAEKPWAPMFSQYL